jgi:SAM-dependent methyltransferase
MLLDRIDALKPLANARLLEVGSAWGWFLDAAARRGARVHGIEPEAANAQLSHSAGLSVEQGFFPADLVDQGPYDFIVFNDVLEHIPHPARLGAEIEMRLAPGGLLVINLPSSDGAIFRLAASLDRMGLHSPYERLWQKGFPSPHVSYFNPYNLSLMIERHSRLRRQLTFSLPSVTRHGLADRVRSSHQGAVGMAIVAGIWGLSYALPLLPPDIAVVVFRAAAPQHN